MQLEISLADRGLLPSPLVRFGIRRLLERRLAAESRRFDFGIDRRFDREGRG